MQTPASDRIPLPPEALLQRLHLSETRPAGKEPCHSSVATDAAPAQRSTTIDRIAAGRGTGIIGSRPPNHGQMTILPVIPPASIRRCASATPSSPIRSAILG